jgi:cytosine/creatinine deaminase
LTNRSDCSVKFKTNALVNRILNARLPLWLLPANWPSETGQPQKACINLRDGRIDSVAPMEGQATSGAESWDVEGAPVLPGLVDAHTHLDKTFTLPRMRNVQPGLLGAIDAMLTDRLDWTASDIHARASRAMDWAYAAGCVHLRTHVDWWEPATIPLAWNVLAQMSQRWRGRIHLEQVSLIKLPLFEDAGQARRLARTVAATGAHPVLGAFVHSSNWSEQALRNVFTAAADAGLDVDLHVDEELNPQAQGLATVAAILKDIHFEGRVVAGHACALAAKPESEALAILDAVARAPITMISLPITNLLLQDAQTGRTPRTRGITLLKEARERGIPMLVASDNVQDPFCRVGSYDPVESLAAGVLAAQLDQPFDVWSESLCRGDWLMRGSAPRPTLVGSPADLVVFTEADAWGWPSRSSRRIVLREGVVTTPLSERPNP